MQNFVVHRPFSGGYAGEVGGRSTRTVCRHAEVATLAASAAGVNPLALVYLNRLSDLLFILARTANAGREEPLWKPGGSR